MPDQTRYVAAIGALYNVPLVVVGVAFTAGAWIYGTELLLIIFTTFKKRSAYSSSLVIASLGVLCFQSSVFCMIFAPWANGYGIIVGVDVGWTCMVTGQSMVLWSRLHLVCRSRWKLRAILIMIITNAILCHGTQTVCSLLVRISVFIPLLHRSANWPWLSKTTTSTQITRHSSIRRRCRCVCSLSRKSLFLASTSGRLSRVFEPPKFWRRKATTVAWETFSWLTSQSWPSTWFSSLWSSLLSGVYGAPSRGLPTVWSSRLNSLSSTSFGIASQTDQRPAVPPVTWNSANSALKPKPFLMDVAARCAQGTTTRSLRLASIPFSTSTTPTRVVLSRKLVPEVRHRLDQRSISPTRGSEQSFMIHLCSHGVWSRYGPGIIVLRAEPWHVIRKKDWSASNSRNARLPRKPRRATWAMLTTLTL